MTGQGLTGSKTVRSRKAESPFLPVLHHYHCSGQRYSLETKGKSKEKKVSYKERESIQSNLD